MIRKKSAQTKQQITVRFQNYLGKIAGERSTRQHGGALQTQVVLGTLSSASLRPATNDESVLEIIWQRDESLTLWLASAFVPLSREFFCSVGLCVIQPCPADFLHHVRVYHLDFVACLVVVIRVVASRMQSPVSS